MVDAVSAPSIDAAAFNCPHCGAMCQQRWVDLYGSYKNVGEFPGRIDQNRAAKAIESTFDTGEKREIQDYINSRTSDLPSLRALKTGIYADFGCGNTFLSECYVCGRRAIWLRDRLIWPVQRIDIKPNVDLPGDVRRDFDEAAAIVSQSPRAAAAILRLAIEKLCRAMGKSGPINSMIGDLVVDGLNPKIQKALDLVRVIGNESVHPGSIDLSDDQQTAISLFKLVNIIAETMISEPNQIDEMFDSLPQSKLEGIATRDAKAISKKK